MQTIVALVSDLLFHVKMESAARQAGREIRFVHSVDAAVQAARDYAAVLVVADLNPRGDNSSDGIDLARKMKANSELRGVRLIGFIPHVLEDRRREAISAGYDAVVARSTFSDKTVDLLSG